MPTTILDTMTSPKAFQSYFSGDTWARWQTYLRALLALPPQEGDMKLFRACTGLKRWPTTPYNESYVPCGRRGGKTSIAALVAAHLALFHDWSAYLSPGERACIFCISQNKSQARIAKDRIEGLLNCQPVFKKMIAKVLTESIELTNGVTIQVKPSSYRSIRGFTIVCAIMEEMSFWRYELESSNPDVEIVRALKPSMATVPKSLLIGISSPYTKAGHLFEMWRKWYGKTGGPLIWKSDTLTMNPTINQQTIDADYEADPVAAATEWGGEFRQDMSSYIDPEAVDACVIPKRFELPFVEGNRYYGFIDPSGGSSDSFSMAISHRDKESGLIVLDVIRESSPPFIPGEIVKEFSDVFAGYKVKTIGSDRYAGQWPVSEFKKHGVEVEHSKLSKSELYLELLPLLNSSSVELLDHKRLTSQLKSLDRRTRSGGKDLIDNFFGHDDLANAAAGVCAMIAKGPGIVPMIWRL